MGAQFAKQGFPTSVSKATRIPKDFPTDSTTILVLDTETRNESAERANRRIRDLGLQCKRAGIPVFYKKIDSTLRGNLGAELDGLLNVFQRLTFVVSPAYPEYGRTIVNGSLLVHRQPVARTEFANDPLSPVRLSAIKDLIRAQTTKGVDSIYLPTVRRGWSAIAAAIRRSKRAGAGIICVDAKTRSDLRNIATACNLTDAVACGSAGLAEEIATTMRAPTRTVMVLSASANSATMSELRRLVAASIPVVKARVERLVRRRIERSEIRRVVNRARAALRSHGSVVVCSALYPSDLTKTLLEPSGSALRDPIASGLAKSVAPIILDGEVRAVIVTGGEMASAFLNQINVRELKVEAEILPGIAVCKVVSGKAEGLKVVTKAGGFGSKGSMIRLVEYLQCG